MTISIINYCVVPFMPKDIYRVYVCCLCVLCPCVLCACEREHVYCAYLHVVYVCTSMSHVPCNIPDAARQCHVSQAIEYVGDDPATRRKTGRAMHNPKADLI